MIYTSLAVVAMSVSAAINPLSSLVHLHPRSPKSDHRIVVTLYNPSVTFRDLKIDGSIYTIHEHEQITIKAPVGTMIYTASRTPIHQRGDVMLELTPQLDHQRILVE